MLPHGIFFRHPWRHGAMVEIGIVMDDFLKFAEKWEIAKNAQNGCSTKF